VNRPPTYCERLRASYDRHYEEYRRESVGREAAVFVPLDIPALAKDLGVDVNSVFGRLYYNLDPRYGVRDASGAKKSLFAPVVGQDRNAINFPLLEAVLAGLWVERRRDRRTFWISGVSLGIAVASLVLSLFAATGALT